MNSNEQERWIDTRIYQEMPPIPDKLITTDGQMLLDAGDIIAGQNVWQSLGGMQVGSIWGHGSYVAPDWTADWLHREGVFILDRWIHTEYKSGFDKLTNEPQAQLIARLTKLLHTDTYDRARGTITVDPIRLEAFRPISPITRKSSQQEARTTHFPQEHCLTQE
jgi:nitric oxide reductase subunit B